MDLTQLALELFVPILRMLAEDVGNRVDAVVRPLRVCEVPRCLAAAVDSIGVALTPYELFNNVSVTVFDSHVKGRVIAEAVLQVQRTGNLAALGQLVEEELADLHVSAPSRAVQRHWRVSHL